MRNIFSIATSVSESRAMDWRGINKTALLSEVTVLPSARATIAGQPAACSGPLQFVIQFRALGSRRTPLPVVVGFLVVAAVTRHCSHRTAPLSPRVVATTRQRLLASLVAAWKCASLQRSAG